MIITGKKILDEFKKLHADARSDLESWESCVGEDMWDSPHDIKNGYPKASILKDKNVVFNILGNKYRLWTKVAYKTKTLIIKKIGTHKDYDDWEIK